MPYNEGTVKLAAFWNIRAIFFLKQSLWTCVASIKGTVDKTTNGREYCWSEMLLHRRDCGVLCAVEV